MKQDLKLLDRNGDISYQYQNAFCKKHGRGLTAVEGDCLLVKAGHGNDVHYCGNADTEDLHLALYGEPANYVLLNGWICNLKVEWIGYQHISNNMVEKEGDQIAHFQPKNWSEGWKQEVICMHRKGDGSYCDPIKDFWQKVTFEVLEKVA